MIFESPVALPTCALRWRVVLVGLGALALASCASAPRGGAPAPSEEEIPAAPLVVEAAIGQEASGGLDARAGEAVAADDAVALESERAEAAGASDSEETLEGALEAYESSLVFWNEGELADTLAALDHAYSLLLDLPEDDPEVERQRDDLRRLVARKIVEVYAARETTVGTHDSAVQRLEGPAVDRELATFRGAERRFLLESYQRSGRYRAFILEVLKENGLPEELAWLPLIESGFKTRARSTAAAVGLWQFIASTGYRYGLERDSWIDERMDPEKSTRAAIAYLKDLHEIFGDWATALAAYNCGEARVLRLIRNQRVDYLDHFWDLYEQLPRETRRYVPRFFAVLEILDDPAAHGVELPEPEARVEVERMSVERSVSLATLDSRLGLPRGTLAELNPELRRDVTPRKSYSLRVPNAAAAGSEAFATLVAQIEEAPEPAAEGGIHRVRSGETLSAIAARYRTSAGTLQRINGLRSAHRIYPGQRLRLPGGVGTGGSYSPGTYRVGLGETLSGIAARNRTSVATLQRLNGLSSPDRIYPGQTLRLPGGEIASGGEAITVTVRSGDSLWKLAQRHATTVQQIQRDNGLSGTRLQVGQRLVVHPGH